MNYSRIYEALIVRARARVRPEGYVERHHIVPRCMGGGDESANIIALTAREHFVAHLLLAKIYPEISGLHLALLIMKDRCDKTPSSWWYKSIREKCMEDWSSRGKSNIHFARTAFAKDEEAKARHRAIMSDIGKRAGPLFGTKNLKGYWVGKEDQLRANGSKGAFKLNEIISSSTELQEARKTHGLKGAAVSKELWKIPAYREARKNRDQTTCDRIKKEYRDRTS